MKIIKKEINTLDIYGDIISIKEEFLCKKFKNIHPQSLFKIIEGSYGYFIRKPGLIDDELYGNGFLFRILEIDRYEFQIKILGYTISPKGGFPFCKTKEDAIKLMNNIVLYNYYE